MNTPLIVIVGAADTGRAPLTAALLRRMLLQRTIDARVESAGVLGHDNDPASPDALAVAEHLSLDLSTHRARSLSADLVDAASLLLAVDRGTARVARLRFPQAEARIHTLGELAGCDRDIPDPFKMQIGPWLIYAREIERLLHQALPRIVAFLPEVPTVSTDSELPAPSQVVAEERRAAAKRTAQLLDLMTHIPGIVEWSTAREQVETTIALAQAYQAGASDLIAAYGALLRAALTLTPPIPGTAHLAALRDAIARLEQPITSEDVGSLSARLSVWSTLA
ncbi:MAG: protein tyrosine phosphatase [Roseiflexus sp.]|jgi:protein-tyrosine-phosphatase|nr:protein tyrosine phosphatase [Roseiflexus sp.]MBO9333542.1 protein tyrosine phosphatase [Roseiflexus sp.]MBO9363340.1 protein tyrosine phosphatase [Roseiflexus sp.]MBO9381002.1 protein tyrosine phosphatase [Roseiflexus sp.]MBO9387865.1 protein tyrosine phosphatase [Roseiflexus sp.]